jgi:hypothetical protein
MAYLGADRLERQPTPCYNSPSTAHNGTPTGQAPLTPSTVWLCNVAERQMIGPSFVSPPPIRKLWDLTRYRADLVAARTAEKNPGREAAGGCADQAVGGRHRHLRGLWAGAAPRPAEPPGGPPGGNKAAAGTVTTPGRSTANALADQPDRRPPALACGTVSAGRSAGPRAAPQARADHGRSGETSEFRDPERCSCASSRVRKPPGSRAQSVESGPSPAQCPVIPCSAYRKSAAGCCGSRLAIHSLAVVSGARCLGGQE